MQQPPSPSPVRGGVNGGEPGGGGGGAGDMLFYGCNLVSISSLVTSISFWEPGAQPNMERAEAIVQRVSQWPVEPNIRLGEGHS